MNTSICRALLFHLLKVLLFSLCLKPYTWMCQCIMERFCLVGFACYPINLTINKICLKLKKICIIFINSKDKIQLYLNDQLHRSYQIEEISFKKLLFKVLSSIFFKYRFFGKRQHETKVIRGIMAPTLAHWKQTYQGLLIVLAC